MKVIDLENLELYGIELFKDHLSQLMHFTSIKRAPLFKDHLVMSQLMHFTSIKRAPLFKIIMSQLIHFSSIKTTSIQRPLGHVPIVVLLMLSKRSKTEFSWSI